MQRLWQGNSSQGRWQVGSNLLFFVRKFEPRLNRFFDFFFQKNRKSRFSYEIFQFNTSVKLSKKYLLTIFKQVQCPYFTDEETEASSLSRWSDKDSNEAQELPCLQQTILVACSATQMFTFVGFSIVRGDCWWKSHMHPRVRCSESSAVKATKALPRNAPRPI